MCKPEMRAALADEKQHIKRFEDLIAQEMVGMFRTAITEEFRALVMHFYLQPSEMPHFSAMHSREV
jgi:hypothetical protein